jgi:hypothetical protein
LFFAGSTHILTMTSDICKVSELIGVSVKKAPNNDRQEGN